MSRIALVTGGTHGIGLATVEALRDELGYSVVSLSRTKLNYDARHYVCDVLDPFQVSCCIDAIITQHGRVDVLVNNVGGGGRWGTENPLETEQLTWDEVMRKNYTATVQFTTALLPHMLKEGWGRVVTVSSIHGREAGGRPWFAVAKSAQIAFMKSMSQMKAFARSGVTFNTVAPGAVYIEGTGWDGAAAEEYAEQVPMGRLGTAKEVAAVIAFLCSDSAAWVSGACIAVDGGEGRSF